MSIKQDLINSELRAAQERARMGAKEYDKWIESQQAYLYSIFHTHEELEKILKKAGYDLIITNTPNHRYVKTHFGKGKWDYYFWFFHKGFLVANYNVGDDIKLIKKFISEMEQVYGEKCFFKTPQELDLYIKSKYKPQKITTVVKMQATKPEQKEEIIQEPEYTFPTIYTDTSVLEQALNNGGIDAKMQGENFKFTLEDCSVSIYQEDKNNYEFKIVGKCDLKNVHKVFTQIETEYNRIVQHNICEKIKNKVTKSPTMQLVQEEVLEDESVLLTISI